MTVENALNIFTDGSSFRSPRTGGIGIRFVTIGSDGNEQIQDLDLFGCKNATNNQMELQACILALKEAVRLQLASRVGKIVVFTDSLYVVENYTKAMFDWPTSRWHLHSGRPVLNAELWKELVRRIKKAGLRVEFRWTKGHSKNIHNRAVDRMARKSAGLPVKKPLSTVTVRRKLSTESVALGSVEIQGQRISIRVITSEYLSVQRVWKYKYEVISKKSKFYGDVDIIFSDIFLKPGHSYYVKVNSEIDNPRIERVFREILKK